MSRIQIWFERITGVTQEEAARRKFAHEFFSQQKFDTVPFQKPACWRRKTLLCQAARNR